MGLIYTINIGIGIIVLWASVLIVEIVTAHFDFCTILLPTCHNIN